VVLYGLAGDLSELGLVEGVRVGEEVLDQEGVILQQQLFHVGYVCL
jgi:hypothetical protein